MSKASEEALAELHGTLASELTNRIKNGEQEIELVECEGEVKEHPVYKPTSPSTLSVARQFLKDNHIEADPHSKGPLKDLVDELPFDENEMELN